MLNQRTSSTMIDLLFNLLLTFVALFFLAFLLVTEPRDAEESNVTADSNFIITMSWEADCDIDLWIQLPTKEKVFYAHREAGPVSLDIDVVQWRSYTNSNGDVTEIAKNQEIATIRGMLEGEYIVNAHYFGNFSQENVPVQITVQDVRAKRLVWAGDLILNSVGHEAHGVRLMMIEGSIPGVPILQIIEGRPKMIIGT